MLDWPISDISAIDIDGDGELEFATIEPFHGEYFRIYKKIDGRFRKVFEHPEVTEFYHVVVGATLAGEPVFIGGCRRGQRQLFYVRAKRKTPLELEAVLIEAGVGPSNVCVVHEPGRDIIVAANREKAEAALYFVTPQAGFRGSEDRGQKTEDSQLPGATRPQELLSSVLGPLKWIPLPRLRLLSPPPLGGGGWPKAGRGGPILRREAPLMSSVL